jgi:putative addiction module killer protein
MDCDNIPNEERTIMIPTKIQYHKDVERWLNKLTNNQLKSVAKELELLKLCGNTLRLPHSKALGKGLFELRERNYGYRIYYSFLENKEIILLNAGNKNTQVRDIKTAQTRLGLF